MLVICKNPNTRMSLMVPKELWPAIVGRLGTFNLKYESDKELKNGKFVRINDISGNGKDLVDFFSSLSVYNKPNEDGSINKIYMLITARRKKYVQENRKEVGGGSEAGDGVRPGSDSESCGSGDQLSMFDPDGVQGSEMPTDYNSSDDSN